MRIRLRGFADYELRPRPVGAERLDGRIVKLDARTTERLLRAALTELPPHRLRALLDRHTERARIRDELVVLAELRRMIDRGQLVFVTVPQRVVSGGPIRVEKPEVYEPAAPEVIVESNDWIEILIVDEDDQPVPDVAYEIELPNGSVRRGRTNYEGIARCERIPPGTCKLTLVELDSGAWSYPA